MMKHECKVCGNACCNRVYTAREMMFGFRDAFDYFQCSHCGCLQIVKIPPNLEKYYPEDYYSFSEPTAPTSSLFRRFLKQHRLRYFLGEKTTLGRLLFKIYGARNLPEWAQRAKLKISDHILDVGCGEGHLLLSLSHAGFNSLTGVDPFIDSDIVYPNGVRVLKKEPSELNAQFDFIMLHHSFEHMSDPVGVLKCLHTILKPDRFVLLRIPVVSSYAWQKYKTNWVQLDAPRHLFLHSLKSIELLAEKTGFKIEDVVFDSTPFQFLGSEQYAKDIPLTDKRSFKNGLKNSIFSEQDILRFEEQAKRLNQEGQGDQAAFYLLKA